MDSADLVRKWWHEVWAGHFDVISEICAEPYVRHGVSGSKSQTHKELESDMRNYLRVHHNPKVEIADQAVAGDRVWSRIRSDGLNLETEELTTICWLQQHRVSDAGLLAEVWTLYSYDANWD